MSDERTRPSPPAGSTPPGAHTERVATGSENDVIDGAARAAAPGPGILPAEDDIGPAGPAANVLAAMVGLVLSALALWLATSYGIGTPGAPGPGLWPAVIAAALGLCSFVLLLRSRNSPGAEVFTRGTFVVIAVGVALVGFGLLIELVGFEVLSVALIALWLRGIGRESWRMTATVSLVATAALYLLFIVALEVPIPHLIAL